MSKSKYSQKSLLSLIGSDSEVEAPKTMPAPGSTAEDMVPVKKARGRPKSVAAKVTKPKATGRRASETKVIPVKRGKRAPLTDKTNEQNAGNDTEEVDEFDQQEVDMNGEPSGDELSSPIVTVRRQKPIAKSKATRKTISSAKDTLTRADNSIAADTPEEPPLDSRARTVTKKSAQGKRQPSIKPRQCNEVIPETQASMMEVDGCGGEEVVEPTPGPVARHITVAPSASWSRQTPVPRRRAGSASDAERNDPATRRKLGELTKQLENMDLKYHNLREIGIKEAERNFERLKNQSEESTKAANSLIASLKADLAAQNAQLKESIGLKKTIEIKASEVSSLQAEVAQLISSLAEAQTENKTLSTKLAASRTVATSVESVNGRVHGSAAKPNRSVLMMGSVEVAQAAQVAQLKEDLYSDLTGLIIRGVKREAEEDVHDCIQTGRNGTLHFKLAVANEKSGESYDDAHCIYIPQLDPSRDKPLMEMLPEYLVEEITFPRPHAAKFYARVVKALTERQS